MSTVYEVSYTKFGSPQKFGHSTLEDAQLAAINFSVKFMRSKITQIDVDDEDESEAHVAFWIYVKGELLESNMNPNTESTDSVSANDAAIAAKTAKAEAKAEKDAAKAEAKAAKEAAKSDPAVLAAKAKAKEDKELAKMLKAEERAEAKRIKAEERAARIAAGGGSRIGAKRHLDTTIITMGRAPDGTPYGGDNNPKRAGTEEHKRFGHYRNGMSVGDYRALVPINPGGALTHDAGKGWIALTPVEATVA